MFMEMNSRGIFNRASGLYGANFASLKQLISWGDHLKTGQPQIDAQHEGIFNIAMEIADRWQEHGNLEEMKKLTEKFGKVLAAHFRYEEQQLEAVSAPNLAEHKAEHTMMLEELQTLRDRLDRMEGRYSLATPGFILQNFVLGVTVGHVGQSDMDYCGAARDAARVKAAV
jgi:hemerythrin-like metal-binding protein